MPREFCPLHSSAARSRACGRLWRLQILVAAGLLAWLLSTAANAGEDLVAPASDAAPPVRKIDLTFTSLGAKPGEHLPRLMLTALDGKPQPLANAWNKPALLLTSSFTCPKSRSRWPEAAKLAKKYGRSLDVVVVYVIEAHPVEDPSPYKGVEDVTPENVRDDILRRQPTSLDERLELSSEFKDLLDV